MADAPKTVRFTRVVERSGQPRVHTLWVPPAKDPEFKRALADHRVMSIHAEGGKTDVGIVGDGAGRSGGGRFLIFPKSLKPFESARVVGIKFDLLRESALVPATAAKPRAPKKPRKATATVRAPAPEPARTRQPVVSETHETTRELQPQTAGKTEIRSPTAALSALRNEVRAAIAELEDGKAVAAHRRLERAVK